MIDSRESAILSRVEELTAEPLMVHFLQKTVCKGTSLFSFCIITNPSKFVKPRSVKKRIDERGCIVYNIKVIVLFGRCAYVR